MSSTSASSMRRLVLVRHAETVWHAEGRYAGQSDIALTANGYEQAAALGRWAETAGLSGIWSSTLSRARETAAPASQATGLPVATDTRLIELGLGHVEGLTTAEIEQRFPAERQAFLADPAENPLPGAERPTDAAARGVAALREIARQAPAEGKTLVVAHSSLFRLILCQLLPVPLSRYRSGLPALANVSLTEVQMSEDAFALLSFNVTLPQV